MDREDVATRGSTVNLAELVELRRSVAAEMAPPPQRRSPQSLESGYPAAVDPAETLLRTALFRDVSRKDVDELLPALGRLAFARGQALWIEGDRAEALYVIARGQVKSFRVSPEGGEMILQLSSDGEILGEVGLFHPSGVRRLSVSAMEPTVCLTLPRQPLLAFMTSHPPVMRRMLESLSEIVGRAGYSLTELAFDDIRRRVVRALLDLAEKQGEAAGSAVRIRLKLSQTSLAAMVAASRENVNRALAPFLERGHISHSEGFFVVHDRAALEEAVDPDAGYRSTRR